jgi:hypothetical protein
MKFWRVHDNTDPAESDQIFPTKKAREDWIKENYDDESSVVRDEIEMNGNRLTKYMVCRIYSLAIR